MRLYESRGAWSVEAVVVEFGEIKLDLRVQRSWQLYRDLWECRLTEHPDRETGPRQASAPIWAVLGNSRGLPFDAAGVA